MAFLVNRIPPSRFECLYSFAKFIVSKFGGYDKKFSLSDVMFDRDGVNIHHFCTLTQSLGDFTYCPFKDNELDDSGCSLTNGVLNDSTKKKEVSNSINAMHALGFVDRRNRMSIITPFGRQFAKAEYGTQEMQNIIKRAVLNYGPVIGVLNQIRALTSVGGEFKATDIVVGYPNTKEDVVYKEKIISLSVGSKRDSNIRTRSCILCWLTTAGFICPTQLPPIEEGEYPHFKYREYLNKSQRNEKFYYFLEDPIPSLRDNQFITLRPLDFKHLTKLTGALRENNQAEVREATMKYEMLVNNRRLAILYFLNQAYKLGKQLKLDNLLSFFHLHKDFFIISEREFDDVIKEELDITNMGGIPFDMVEKEGQLYLAPNNGINEDELCLDADDKLMEILKSTKL